MDRDALLLIRGECPVLDRKYDLNRHPNIRYTEMGGAPPCKVPEDYWLSAGIPAEDVQEEWVERRLRRSCFRRLRCFTAKKNWRKEN